MGIVKDYLDPNAQAYANLAALDSAAATKLSGIADGADVNPADLAALDSTANDKLTGIDAGATVDQTGLEVKDLIVALADDDREIVISRPQAGQFKLYAVQRHSDGTYENERSDTAES